jgi:poly(hydroxyalkanoate) depolymerase family esterase
MPTQKSRSQNGRKTSMVTAVGRLMDDVSLLVQRALEGSALSPTAPPARPAWPRTESRAPAGSAGLVIDGVVKDRVEPRQGNAAKVPASRATRPTAFTESNFVFEEHTYPYRLFVPALTGDPSPMPLIVLLHGCTQDAQDFARGTSMNDLAGRHGCMVLYPEQISKANSQRCWNWYERDHQQLGRGEPGMIAALTQQVLAAHQGPKGADPGRVYIAGLSAGGAMAAVVAGLYPDIFAAVGVHSGLASGSAQDMVSAFSAMRRGAKGQSVAALPTIVFHGSGDTTVHPDNGDYISDAALDALQATGLKLSKSRTTAGADQQATERIIYRSSAGPSYVEYWRVGDGQHAWSGGDAAGSFTDPVGPSASAAMLEFFLQHKKA